MARPAPPLSEPAPTFCTIIAKNYLARARVLARSLRTHHPESSLEVLVVDDPEGLFDPAREDFRVRFLDELALPRPREMTFRYGILELCTAVKPFFLRLLLAEGHERIVYLDPDVQVFGPLTEAIEGVGTASLVLTPHLLEAAHAPHWERNVLVAGTYNLGFLALRDGRETRHLLDWWAERCETLCLQDPARGLYVDQRWMDLAPGFVAHTVVLRHPGYNVGRWNLAERKLAGTAGAPRVGDMPLVFMHWSGLDQRRPDRLTLFRESRPVDEEPLRTLMRHYVGELRECGEEACALWTYSHGRLRDGRPITQELRALFREQPVGRFEDPFDPSARDGFVASAKRSLWNGPLPRALGLGSESRRVRLRRLVDRLALRLPPALGAALERCADRAAFSLNPRAGGAGTLMARVLSLFDTRPDLRAAFPQAFVEAHDGGRFVEALAQASGALGLSEGDVNELRALLATHPGERLTALHRARPDVARTLGGSDSSLYLAWLRHSGRLEYGITEDEVLWFARGRDQHVCLQVQALYERRPEWRRAHPLAFTRAGRRAFLEFVRAEAPPSLAAGLATLDELCLPEGGEWPQTASSPRPALLAGWHDAPTGMGEFVRATRRALVAASYPLALAPIDATAKPLASDAAPGRAPLPILHLNALEAPTVASRFPTRLHERPLVGYCTWELATAPAGWGDGSGVFDEVWTLSAFSSAALAPSCPAPVVVFPPCLDPPRARQLGRADFGLDDEFVVLFAFDMQSEMDRKNPLALVEAFRRAFRPDDRARLLLKVTSAEERPLERQRLVDAAAGLPVTLLERTLTRDAFHDLVRACDVYASLHRSEGFGLSLAEAMRLGRPVVATHYSGNLDFMNPWNSFAVPYRIVEVTRDAGPYRRGEAWAEPDVEAAATLLRRVFLDREGAGAVAERGRADVEARLSPEAIGTAMAARLRHLGGGGRPLRVDLSQPTNVAS